MQGHERVVLEVPDGKSVIKALNNIAELSTVKLSKVRNPQLQELLVDMERKELIMYGNYKFGVLYWRDGLTEDEMFAQSTYLFATRSRLNIVKSHSEGMSIM